MTTAYLTHPSGCEHRTPEGHPERSERLRAVQQALSAPAFAGLRRESAPAGAEVQVLLAHPRRYVERVRAAIPQEGVVPLDPDTWVSAGSLDAAMHAVGGICRAVDMVCAGEAANAFLAMRPPGHHAEREKSMGFCLFGTAAIGAFHALENHGLGRVAVVDFDVHHGNGTQDLLWDEPRAFFASTHEMPLYPGSGAASETGAHGQILNVPLAARTAGPGFRAAFEAQVLPRLEAHAPELVIISAGFDAHRADPLASLELEDEDFAWATARICDVAERSCGGRVVSTLEGGYDLDALAASVAAHVAVLMERGAG